jgi:hypothetical protein
LYPGLVSLFIASIYFPLGLGQFMASTLTTQQQVISLFSNFTWSRDDLSVEQEDMIAQWRNQHTNIFVSLGIFSVITVSFCPQVPPVGPEGSHQRSSRRICMERRSCHFKVRRADNGR